MQESTHTNHGTRGDDASPGDIRGRASSPRRFAPRSGCAALWLCAAMLIAGCSGSADICLTSLRTDAIDPPSPDVVHYAADECVWWVNGAGDLNIAMTSAKHNLLLGKLGRQEVLISFALEAPPAGSGRNYTIRSRETRAIVASPLMTQRLASYSGILSTLVDDDEHIHGSFRILVKPLKEPFLLSFMPQEPSPMLLFGTYSAVKNAELGEEIRLRTEACGWLRPAKKQVSP